MRQPLLQVTRRYDRMARWYRAAEITLLLPHRLRKKAVQRLDLRPGETVLEIGCGTGRNLPLLCDGVGEEGQVIGVDASSGMLARAQEWVTHHNQQNVLLRHQDADELTSRLHIASAHDSDVHPAPHDPARGAARARTSVGRRHKFYGI